MKTNKKTATRTLTAEQADTSKAEFKAALREQEVEKKMGLHTDMSRRQAPPVTTNLLTTPEGRKLAGALLKAGTVKMTVKLVKAPKASAKATALPVLRKSKVDNPVALVWELCDKNPKARRRDILAMAAEKGVATNTAASQYQYWRAAGKTPATTKGAKGGKK